ncbi:MAG: CBS domain-containing protein [Candidatus Altiarchaeota archaeon]
MFRGSQRYSDIKGGMDRGPKKHVSHVVKHSGDVMKVASKDVIITHPSNTIKNAASLMRDNDVRRLPVLDAGTRRLSGLVTAIDLLDFLGGGEKYNIIEKDYGGNFLAAINSPISKIMRQSQYLDSMASVEDAVSIMLDKHSSCIPIVSDSKTMGVVGLVTERDVLPHTDDKIGVAVGRVMKPKPITATLGMMLSDVSKIMVRNQLRRLPVIRQEEVVGLVTVFDVLGFLEGGEYKGVGAEENLSTRVDEIMEENIISVAPEDDLDSVVGLIHDTGYGGFPVVKDGRLEGVITTTDVLRWVYRQN